MVESLINEDSSKRHSQVIDDSLKNLLRKSQDIALLEQDIFEFTKNKNNHELDLSFHKSKIYLEISTREALIEGNIVPKKVFTNEGQRQSEFDRIVSQQITAEQAKSDDTLKNAFLYQASLQSLKDCEDFIADKKRKHGDLLRQFSLDKLMFEYILLGKRQ